MAAKLRAPVKVIHGDALQVMSACLRFSGRDHHRPPYSSGAGSEEAEPARQGKGVRTKTGNPFHWFVGDK
jgi:hypothetical protein